MASISGIHRHLGRAARDTGADSHFALHACVTLNDDASHVFFGFIVPLFNKKGCGSGRTP